MSCPRVWIPMDSLRIGGPFLHRRHGRFCAAFWTFITLQWQLSLTIQWVFRACSSHDAGICHGGHGCPWQMPSTDFRFCFGWYLDIPEPTSLELLHKVRSGTSGTVPPPGWQNSRLELTCEKHPPLRFVLIWWDGARPLLSPVNDGPFLFLERSLYAFWMQIGPRVEAVSTHCLKLPASRWCYPCCIGVVAAPHGRLPYETLPVPPCSQDCFPEDPPPIQLTAVCHFSCGWHIGAHPVDRLHCLRRPSGRF
jgi:hypothetical protein